MVNVLKFEHESRKGVEKQCRVRSDGSWFRVFPVCYFVKYFVNSSPFIWGKKMKSVRNLEHFPYILCVLSSWAYQLVSLS